MRKNKVNIFLMSKVFNIKQTLLEDERFPNKTSSDLQMQMTSKQKLPLCAHFLCCDETDE